MLIIRRQNIWRLPFVDFVAFNVYLESREQLAAYLARLQNLAGERPLLLAEVGLDSRRNGEEAQAATLKWQIETIFEGGCAGAFVFAWTDEWHRGGYDIEDWDFGLTTRDRRAKAGTWLRRESLQGNPFCAATSIGHEFRLWFAATMERRRSMRR